MNDTTAGTDAPTAGADESGFNPLTALLTGGGLLGAAVLAKKPGLAGKGIEALMSLRQQLMLSGMAIPKTVLGNTGGAAIKSIERGSMDPLKELFSGTTVRDLINEYKTGAASYAPNLGQTANTPQTLMHGPGRVLGALDVATQNAMKRAGLSADEAEAMVMQTSLGKLGLPGLADAMDSPVARYAIPFRRTPFNQLVQGLETVKPKNLQTGTQKALLAGSVVAGGAHGAATADNRFPASLGLGGAVANKYSLPYLVSAAAGRALAGGRDPSSVVGEALPVSEYGVASGFTEPTKTFTDPAILRVLRRLIGAQ